MSIWNLGTMGAGAAAGPAGLGTALGVSGINALLNLLGGNAEAGRMEDLRAELMKLFSAGSLTNEANNIFGNLQRSPMYSAMRGSAMEGATQLANSLQASYARAGLGRSGIAAASVPLARASTLGNFQNIDADLFMKALGAAQSLLGSRAGVLMNTSGPKGWQIGMGNTLQSIQPLLLQYFMNKFPSGGAPPRY